VPPPSAAAPAKPVDKPQPQRARSIDALMSDAVDREPGPGSKAVKSDLLDATVAAAVSDKARPTPKPAQPTAAEPATKPSALKANPPKSAPPAKAVVMGPSVEQVQVNAPHQDKRIVVPQFNLPNSRARALVLRALADHPEVEVMALDDVTFAARRLQADATQPAGREKLSRELGIDAWLDGTIDAGAGEAQLKLTAADGQVLQQVTAAADEPKKLDDQIAQRMWLVLGPKLSAKEARRRVLLALSDRAHHKVDARTTELQRQVKLAHERRQHRALVLRQQFALAQRKRAALTAEHDRQVELGHQELARVAEAERQAELARKAEEARKLELARQEAERKAEEKRKLEEARKAEIARKAEEKRQAEEARKAEIARVAEEKRERKREAAEARKEALARKAEEKREAAEARKEALARKAEEKRLAQRERQEELAREADERREAKAARREELARAAEEKRSARRERKEEIAR